MATISMKLDRRRANARGLFPIQFLLHTKGTLQPSEPVLQSVPNIGTVKSTRLLSRNAPMHER